MVRPKVALPNPCLCLVTDRGLLPDGSLADAVIEAVAGGVTMVQVREKDLPGGPLLDLARELTERIAGRALLIVNERVDVALAVEADGVHLGEQALAVGDARRLAGPDLLIGRSVHAVEAATKAEEDGADYLIAGAIFPTRSHPGREPGGPALVRRIAGAVRIPVLGIGGVTPRNVAGVMDAGAAGVAVISSILAAERPREAADAFAMAMRHGARLRSSATV